MSEPQNTDSGQQPQTPESTPPAEAQNTENAVPQSRFNEVIQERNALQQRLVALESAQQQNQDKELAEQNRYKELAEGLQKRLDELQVIEAENTRNRAALQATNEARLQQIPEDKRSYIPVEDDPVKIGAWLDINLPKLLDPGKPAPPKLDGGSGSGGGVGEVAKLTQAEIDVAKAANIPLEEFAKVNINRTPIILAKDNKGM